MFETGMFETCVKCLKWVTMFGIDLFKTLMLETLRFELYECLRVRAVFGLTMITRKITKENFRLQTLELIFGHVQNVLRQYRSKPHKYHLNTMPN